MCRCLKKNNFLLPQHQTIELSHYKEEKPIQVLKYSSFFLIYVVNFFFKYFVFAWDGEIWSNGTFVENRFAPMFACARALTPAHARKPTVWEIGRCIRFNKKFFFFRSSSIYEKAFVCIVWLKKYYSGSKKECLTTLCMKI